MGRSSSSGRGRHRQEPARRRARRAAPWRRARACSSGRAYETEQILPFQPLGRRAPRRPRAGRDARGRRPLARGAHRARAPVPGARRERAAPPPSRGTATCGSSRASTRVLAELARQRAAPRRPGGSPLGRRDDPAAVRLRGRRLVDRAPLLLVTVRARRGPAEAGLKRMRRRAHGAAARRACGARRAVDAGHGRARARAHAGRAAAARLTDARGPACGR